MCYRSLAVCGSSLAPIWALMHLNYRYRCGKFFSNRTLVPVYIHFENFNSRFPFDIGNPIGYSLAAGIEFIFTINIELFTMCVMIIAIGPCLTLISMASDLRYSLHTLNRSARANAKPSETTQQFNRLIDFHSNAKQLSKFGGFIASVVCIWFSFSQLFSKGWLKTSQTPWNSYLPSFSRGAWHRYAVVCWFCKLNG